MKTLILITVVLLQGCVTVYTERWAEREYPGACDGHGGLKRFEVDGHQRVQEIECVDGLIISKDFPTETYSIYKIHDTN